MKRIARTSAAAIIVLSIATTGSAAPRQKDRSNTPAIKRLVLKLINHFPSIKTQDDLPVVPRP